LFGVCFGEEAKSRNLDLLGQIPRHQQQAKSQHHKTLEAIIIISKRVKGEHSGPHGYSN
jgi:hypothetical protein